MEIEIEYNVSLGWYQALNYGVLIGYGSTYSQAEVMAQEYVERRRLGGEDAENLHLLLCAWMTWDEIPFDADIRPLDELKPVPMFLVV